MNMTKMCSQSEALDVPMDPKQERYRTRRRKNNLAAKRSRDARRAKEDQIARRAAYLEEENMLLRDELRKMSALLENMKQRLLYYEHSE